MWTLRLSWTLRACATCMAVAALSVPAMSQSVISTRSGVVYYFDGAVYVNDQPLASRPGKFPILPPGAELRAAAGHAEVLLTPGVFLRVGENSSIRMLSNNLADTRVQLQTGSVIVDSAEPSPGTAVTLIFGDWQVRSEHASTYRIDSDPPRVWALKGDADVAAGNGDGDRSVTVEEGMDVPLAAKLSPELSLTQPADSLSDWSKGRSESIDADNTITQQIDADPDSVVQGPGDFSYFPALGVPPMGVYSSSPYSSVVVAQPGFYSMYLPGYTYSPLLILPVIGRVRGVPLPFPIRSGILPGGVVPGVVPGMGGIVRPVYPGVAGPRPRPLPAPALHPAVRAVPAGRR